MVEIKMAGEQKEYLTKEKYQELEAELLHLKKDKRREVAENLEYARSLGDLAENAEYHEARQEQAELEERITKLEAILKSAEIIAPHHKTGEVKVGSVVTVLKENQTDSKTYIIVGSEEADAAAGRISIRSPFGRVILGKKKDQSFSFQTPSGLVKYKILDIK